ncbi:RraA family protein [Pseudonocardia ailaonensis]|uniref:Putative 4-hydroxy-4-methyl-2-oxoglutarate aldolase n=1 Tax=Pseudonocardia ailaonensis TaxID=367279 RepID=A0ABN2NNS6_9PSEU
MASDVTIAHEQSPSTLFEGLDSATIHEAQGKTGELPSSIRAMVPDPLLCGPAFTVECPGVDNLWLHRALYEAAPGDVLVVDVAEDGDAGYWGEVLSHAARARGLAGLVINACVRDGARLGAVGLPVFATGLHIRGTGKDPHGRGFLNRPVRFGRTVVAPGDIVFGDLDGVVVVPADRMVSVVDEARRRTVAETDIIDRLRNGESTLDIYGLRTFISHDH